MAYPMGKKKVLTSVNADPGTGKFVIFVSCSFAVKARLRFIFVIAGLTTAGIITSQVYWVYSNYTTANYNFRITVHQALVRSIDTYQLERNQLPASLKYANPTLTFFLRTIPNQDSLALDHTLPKFIKPFHSEFVSVLVDSNNMEIVSTLLARLLAQQRERPINLDTLNQLFRQELSRSNIEQPFTLAIHHNQNELPAGKIAALIGFRKVPMVIEALPKGIHWRPWNMMPALAALALILLSAGSLWYMGVIILRQMKLDGIKNDFINNVTHELRTPVSILKSSNESMANFGGANDPARLARHLSINAAILDKLDNTVDRILEITLFEQGVKTANYAPVQVADIIQATIQSFSLHQECTIALINHLTTAEINTDGYIIETILSNLIDNAIKYSHESVAINISISNTNGGWQLTVADNGNGISQEHLPFIFNKFYRIQQDDIHDVKGYGLGLNYVKQLVSVLHGSISVTSKVSQGTTFVLEFPL